MVVNVGMQIFFGSFFLCVCTVVLDGDFGLDFAATSWKDEVLMSAGSLTVRGWSKF